MWAMIATSIAMVVWATILLYFTTRHEKRRVREVSHDEALEPRFSLDEEK
jgi:ACS family pantothenate transporter-like MFS transporter